MVVKLCGTFVKAPRVPGILVPEQLVVKMVAKFVAQRAEERPVRGYLLADGRPHPDGNKLGGGIVITEKFRVPAALATAKGTGREDPDRGGRNLVELGCGIQKPVARLPDRRCGPSAKRRLNGYGRLPQPVVFWNVEDSVPVAFQEFSEQGWLAGFTVGEHNSNILDCDAGATQAWLRSGRETYLKPLVTGKRSLSCANKRRDPMAISGDIGSEAHESK